MEIGTKIKNARIEAKLTQEQVAEVLGVSRQTISNWENGKTYPDIVSVIKMSDLYQISLDLLLKEEQPMSNYLNYLEESTNVVKSKDKLAKLVLIMTYLVVWAVCVISFWFFTEDSDALGYSIMYLGILLPVTTMALSFLIGKNDYWGKWKWLSVVAFGFLYMLAEYTTFSAANWMSTGAVRVPDFSVAPIGAAISVIGLGIGSVIHCWKSRKKK